MATSIHPSIPVLSPSFLYHPYIPSFQSKDFSFTCLLPFFGCTLHISLRNILPQAICCCSFMPCYLNCLMYACLLQFLMCQLDRWPEAICCCLQLILLLMYCRCWLPNNDRIFGVSNQIQQRRLDRQNNNGQCAIPSGAYLSASVGFGGRSEPLTMLLIMAFFVTSADKRQLFVY